MTDRDDRLERGIEMLQELVTLDRALNERVMHAVRSSPSPLAWSQRVLAGTSWLWRRQTVRVSPLTGLALAAALALVWLSAGQTGAPSRDAAPVAAIGGSVVQFVIVAPSAGGVSLVGDFNDWGPDITPMTRAPSGSVWSVTLPLDPGRYRYAFLVDGEVWLSDPSAPPAQDDEFGRPGSVVTVGAT